MDLGGRQRKGPDPCEPRQRRSARPARAAQDRAGQPARPGRTQSSHGPGNDAYEETDWHELGKERFAGDIAVMLYKHAHASSYDELVLIAAPDVLGNLRKALHKEVIIPAFNEEQSIARVVAEIPKGLTQLPLDQLEKRLPQDLEDAD